MPLLNVLTDNRLWQHEHLIFMGKRRGGKYIELRNFDVSESEGKCFPLLPPSLWSWHSSLPCSGSEHSNQASPEDPVLTSSVFLTSC